MLAVTQAQVGNSAFDAAEEVADAIDGTHIGLIVEKLFEGLANDVRALTPLLLGCAIELLG
jgi:hypothetical protein